MSMTNEVVKIGVQPFISEFQNQFRAMFSYWVNEIDTKGFCDIENIEDIKLKDTSMYEFLRTRNIQAKFRNRNKKRRKYNNRFHLHRIFRQRQCEKRKSG